MSIRFIHEHLTGNDVLAFTKSQLDKIAEAYHNNKKALPLRCPRLKYSSTGKLKVASWVHYLLELQQQYCQRLPLTYGIRYLVKDNTSRDERSSGIVKVKQFGTGLYLWPCKTHHIRRGLTLKTGQGHEQIKNHSISDVAFINELLK